MVHIGVTVTLEDDALFKKFTGTNASVNHFLDKIIYFDRNPYAKSPVNFVSLFPNAKIIPIKQYYEEIDMP